MDFELSEEHKLVQKTARDFAQEVLARDAAERDENERFPVDAISKLGKLGFMGIMVPEKYGGAGMDTLAYVLVVEEIAKVDAAVAIMLSVNNSLACGAISHFGDEEQKQKFLVPIAGGEKLGAFALSEANAGSDVARLSTTARREGDFYLLNGSKIFITSAESASTVILFATTNKEKGADGISSFIIEKGTPGFKVGKRERKLGVRSSDTCELLLENCKIPKENLLSEEGEGLKIALSLLDSGRIGVAAQATGIAQACLEAALRYSKERKQFGKFISEFQAIRFKLADMAVEIEAARLLTYKAALKEDKGEKFAKEAAMAKLKASEVAMKCAVEAVQIYGGYGYTKDFPVERYLRDAKVTEIYEGTSEIQRVVIARDLLK